MKLINSPLNLNRVVIAIFLICNIGFYFAQYSLIINIGYYVLFSYFAYRFFIKSLHFNRFIFWIIIYSLYTFISITWSFNVESSLDAFIQMLKVIVPAMILSVLVNNEHDFRWAVFSLSIAALLFAILYMQNVDVSKLAYNRITMATEDVESAPNVNIVALYLSTSFTFFIFYFFKNRNYLFLVLAIISIVIIVTLGSRKSILAIGLCLVLVIYKLNSGSRGSLLSIIIIGATAVIMYLPEDYLLYIGDRFSELNDVANGKGGADDSRVKMLQRGVEYFLSSPILGHGYYTYRDLFKMTDGLYLYSHNNFVDVAVGGGIVGFVIYYYIYIQIFKNIKKVKRPFKIDDRYMSLVMLIQLLFNGLFIVYLNDRFVWILLALLYSYNGFNTNINSTSQQSILERTAKYKA